MARKGNQQKNGLERQTSNHKKVGLDSGSPLSRKNGRVNLNETNVIDEEEPLSANQQGTINEGLSKTNRSGTDKKSKKKSENFVRTESEGTNETQGLEQPGSCGSKLEDCIGNMSTAKTSSLKEETLTPDCDLDFKNRNGTSNQTPNGSDKRDSTESEDLPYAAFAIRMRNFTTSVIKTSKEWLERHRPLFDTVVTNILLARDYVRMKIGYAYPIVLRWLLHFANIMLLLLMLWLDCTLRGVDSVLRMGTTSFLTVIWCSVLSLVAMIGFLKFFAFVAIAALIGLFLNFTIAILLTAVSGVAFLWFYGSFWTTALFIFLAGLSFTFKHERLAMFITTVYSVYCAWTYIGWLGLFLGLNLSFISSDALIFFLRNNINEYRRSSSNPEQSAGMQGGPGIFSGEHAQASFAEGGKGQASDRSPGVPSTSGSDSDLTSEDEVIRLLNSTDHYSALGLSRFEEVDVSVLKREYRKKAMLVHPDKNMGNEKAAEAFKKLQNAYEVLLDSIKRKTYDDELRREDLLNYFRRFQNSPQKNKGHGLFGSTYGRSNTDFDDPLGESRRIACRKCNSFHMWFYTKKTKTQARFCQDCKDFHQAKDGDGWVEQSSQPLLFGILQKVDAPCAYVCADSKIFDATEWYICQGMRCPANTHKPSFHVNTSVTSKNTNGKGTSSGQRGTAAAGIPEENMTEEEFFDWLRNAVQSGMFDNLSGTTSDNHPPPWAAAAGNSSKSGGNNAGTSASGGSNGGSKRKKKGKKW